MSDNVKVTVRVRPFITREVGDATPISWDIQDSHAILQVDPVSHKPLGAPYMFDGVFGPEAQNGDVYCEVAMPIVESALTGFNGTIFVYGQTSSGETYTTMGDRNSLDIVPLAVQNIFSFIEDTPDREYLLRFASRAKAVKNKPIGNEVLSDAALLKRCAWEIKGLQHTLALERNTDKAQEVERVREILGEQSRKNAELEAKIQELKTKLVVSSLPRGCTRHSLDKKARRETWCAPAMCSSRNSLGSALSVPIHPLSQEEFGKDDSSFVLNQAEKAKLDETEGSFQFSPCLVNTNRRKRRKVKFDVAPSPPLTFTSEIGCH